MKINSNLEERHLDGIYFRVQVGEKWVNKCLTDISWEEVQGLLAERIKSRNLDTSSVEIVAEQLRFMAQIAAHFHQRLRTIGDELDLATKE